MGYSKVSRVKELPDSLVKSIEDKTYYINPVSGSDNNPGTSAAPFQTTEPLETFLPDVIDHTYRIVCQAGDYSRTFTSPVKEIGVNGSLMFDGETVEVLGETTMTGGDAYDEDGKAYFEKTGAGWTINAYQGKFLEIVTSDATEGWINTKYIPITSNTATRIYTPLLYWNPSTNTVIKVVTFAAILTNIGLAHFDIQNLQCKNISSVGLSS